MGLTFDGLTKVITLTTGTTSLSVRELWSRWTDWFLTSDNSKYLPAFSQVGGDDIDPVVGTTIPIYAFLMNGWKLKPQESNHTLTISDGILLVDGGGDPFNNTTGAYTVRINYQQPVQAITVSTGGGSGITPADIYSHFTTDNREELFKADISTLAIAGEYDTDVTQIVEILRSIMGGEAWENQSLVSIQTAIDSLNSSPIMDVLVDGEFTFRQVIQIMASALAGKLSGGGTSTLTFRDLSDTLNRIVVTVDQNGNRNSIQRNV